MPRRDSDSSAHPADPRARPWWRLAVGLTLALLIAGTLYFDIAPILVLIFGGILVGAVLRLLTDLLVRVIPLPYRTALILVVLGLIAVMAVLLWLGSGAVVAQVRLLPATWARLRQDLGNHTWGRLLLEQVDQFKWASGQYLLPRIGGAASATAEALTYAVVVLFVGLYSAYEPSHYAQGIVMLFPKSRHQRIREVLHAVDYALRWWIIGQGITMLVLGVLVGVGLWIIGIPLALLLGLFSALLAFVPTFGALIALVPPVLLAAVQGPRQVIYVLLLWVAVHILEGYILSPFIQRRAARLPPAVGIAAQILLGALLGVPGLLFAYPLVIAVMVVVQMMYVEDVLGHRTEVPGEHDPTLPGEP